MHEQRYDWLTELERGIAQKRHVPGRVRKVLASATLSHDPELLAQFRLHKPRLICERADASATVEAAPAATLPPNLTQVLVKEQKWPLSMLLQLQARTTVGLRPLTLHMLLLNYFTDVTKVLIFVESK